MTQISAGWGSGPGGRYDELAARFRPIFARIAEESVARETSRVLPFDEIGWLKEARFGALRVPVENGGFGATLPELFGLLVELSEADSNVTQALRSHFGFAEDVLNSRDGERRHRWLSRLAGGDLAGNAFTELGDGTATTHATRVSHRGGEWRLNGEKFYTTGSLFADWIDVAAQADEARVNVTVRRDAPGVTVKDDWDGFGQIGTASGTTSFTDVRVAAEEIVAEADRFAYGQAFFQLVHLATLAGIGRAAAQALAKSVSTRTRQFTNAAAPRPSQDAQVLQVVGRVRAAAYGSGAIVLKIAESLQRVFELRSTASEAARQEANNLANIEAAQGQTVVTDLILHATTILFDALGASATRKTSAFDRFWRNARTIASHNPRIYKDRVVGDFAVNGTEHPGQWQVGKAG